MVNLRVVGLLVALAACDRGAVKAGPSCDAVAAQIVTVQTKGKQSVSTMEAKAAIAKRCTDDKWAEQARTCISKATSRDEMKKCTHDKLTGEQADKLTDATRGLGGGAQEALAKMREFTDKMCQCRDAKCAQQVADDLTIWGQEMSKQEEAPKMSEKDTEEAAAIGTRMGECMTKAMTADLPPDPPADTVRPGDRELKEGDVVDGQVLVK